MKQLHRHFSADLYRIPLLYYTTHSWVPFAKSYEAELQHHGKVIISHHSRSRVRIFHHTSGLIDSKNSSVNLSRKWDSSKCADEFYVLLLKERTEREKESLKLWLYSKNKAALTPKMKIKLVITFCMHLF